MSLREDHVSKPVTGRYFPCSLSDLVAQVELHSFAVHEYYERIQVRLENCKAECDRGYQLCTFMYMNYLAIFSLPIEMPRGIVCRALEEALRQFRNIDLGPKLNVRSQQFVVYRAFLGPLGELSITQHVVSGGYRSYLHLKKATQLPKSASSTKGQQELYRIQLI